MQLPWLLKALAHTPWTASIQGKIVIKKELQ
jgi:hypothetical protein